MRSPNFEVAVPPCAVPSFRSFRLLATSWVSSAKSHRSESTKSDAFLELWGALTAGSALLSKAQLLEEAEARQAMTSMIAVLVLYLIESRSELAGSGPIPKNEI